MGHEILIQNGEASMFYFGKEPWHGLGTKLDKPATAQEAILAAKLDWPVVKEPLYAGDGGERFYQVPKRFAVVPGHRWGKADCPVFGIVGTEYTPLQNHEAFEFFDHIVGRNAAILKDVNLRTDAIKRNSLAPAKIDYGLCSSSGRERVTKQGQWPEHSGRHTAA